MADLRFLKIFDDFSLSKSPDYDKKYPILLILGRISNRRNGVRVSENPKIFETFFKFFFGPKSSKKEFGEVWDQSEHYSKSYFFHTEGRFFFIREISLFLKKDLAKNDLYLELRFSVPK